MAEKGNRIANYCQLRLAQKTRCRIPACRDCAGVCADGFLVLPQRDCGSVVNLGTRRAGSRAQLILGRHSHGDSSRAGLGCEYQVNW
jgi:hypothetical protein